MADLDETEHRRLRRATVSRLGHTIRCLRQEGGLSQEQVAHSAGITVYTYGSIERGRTPRGHDINPTLDTLLRIANALNTPLLLELSAPNEDLPRS